MEFNKTQMSLLIFLECAAVDTGGLVIGSRMNTSEFAIANQWNEEGFIQFGRIAMADIQNDSLTAQDHWVVLSEKAWEFAHQFRKERSKRLEMKISKERLGLKAEA